jgi:hypothetical protein
VFSLDDIEEWVLSILDVNEESHDYQVDKKGTTNYSFGQEKARGIYANHHVLVGNRVYQQKPEE